MCLSLPGSFVTVRLLQSFQELCLPVMSGCQLDCRACSTILILVIRVATQLCLLWAALKCSAVGL